MDSQKNMFERNLLLGISGAVTANNFVKPYYSEMENVKLDVRSVQADAISGGMLRIQSIIEINAKRIIMLTWNVLVEMLKIGNSGLTAYLVNGMRLSRKNKMNAVRFVELKSLMDAVNIFTLTIIINVAKSVHVVENAFVDFYVYAAILLLSVLSLKEIGLNMQSHIFGSMGA